MASTSGRPVSDGTNFTLVSSSRRRKQDQSVPLLPKLMTTVATLALLAVVLKFFPPISSNARVHAAPGSAQAAPADLRVSEVQISEAFAGDAIYLDGLVTNAGDNWVTAAMTEMGFHDGQGNLVASVQKPLVGMPHGGADVIPNEFARNPIKPNEMRFFRIAVDEVSPSWNHEVPEVKIVELKAQ